MGRVAPFGLLLPVFAQISSVLFLGDRMTPKLVVGGLLAILRRRHYTTEAQR